MATEIKTAYAALDIGTSQLKLGVYCPHSSKRIHLIKNLSNELVYGRSGEVRAEYQPLREKCFTLFTELGGFLQSNNIEQLYLGICGHVSSLLEWNRSNDSPTDEAFPIWLDTSCHSSLAEYNLVMGNGKSKEIIGTFLPAGTNWLFTKLLHRRKSRFTENSIFLQVSDAIFFELTGKYHTHFSSQISMVDLKKREYAGVLLEHLQLQAASLPKIELSPSRLQEPLRTKMGFPSQSFVFPAMADLYTSLYGLKLQDREGFMLANTSEQAGVFFMERPKILDNFLSISFNTGFINYGSTNTGGNILNWLVKSILHKEPSPTVLNELTARAAVLAPYDTPIVLPYLQGERAPLWNSKLTASVLELNSSHTDIHLFRAILEAISFARRQCFEQLGIEAIDIIKLAGGSSKNSLWNTIRASVLNKQIAVADEKELSLAGMIYYIMEAIGSAAEKPPIDFVIEKPHQELVNIYDERYRRFIKYQELLT